MIEKAVVRNSTRLGGERRGRMVEVEMGAGDWRVANSLGQRRVVSDESGENSKTTTDS